MDFGYPAFPASDTFFIVEVVYISKTATSHLPPPTSDV